MEPADFEPEWPRVRALQAAVLSTAQVKLLGKSDPNWQGGKKFFFSKNFLSPFFSVMCFKN